MGMIMLGTQNYKTLGGKRYHKISKHASLISLRWLFVHWFFKTNFFICFFFFFIFSFKNFITLLLCAMASALLLIIFIDYIIFVVVGGEVFVSVRSSKWFKNDVHNENHVKNHVCTMGSSSTVFFCSAA